MSGIKKKDKNLGKVENIINFEWDPIGILGEDHEYSCYIKEILSLIDRGSSKEDIFNYLWRVETIHMGLSGNVSLTDSIAKKLHALGTR